MFYRFTWTVSCIPSFFCALTLFLISLFQQRTHGWDRDLSKTRFTSTIAKATCLSCTMHEAGWKWPGSMLLLNRLIQYWQSPQSKLCSISIKINAPADLWIPCSNRSFPSCWYLCFKTSPRAKPFWRKCVSSTSSFSCKSTYFHMNGFVRGLLLKQMHKVASKWPIDKDSLPAFSSEFCVLRSVFVRGC